MCLPSAFEMEIIKKDAITKSYFAYMTDKNDLEVINPSLTNSHKTWQCSAIRQFRPLMSHYPSPLGRSVLFHDL